MLPRAGIYMLVAFFACQGLATAGSGNKDDMEALEKFLQSDVVAGFQESAYAYAIFPTIGKGGMGIGAAHGKGRVYRDGKKLGDVSMTQLSIGLQFGGQAYRQLVYFEDERALKDFTSGNFEFGAQAEAIAITASASAQAGTDGSSASANDKQARARYHKGMIVFTIGKGGLMYQAALGGQKYEFTPAN